MSNENYINLLGVKIPIKNERIDINKLHFYPENPRILSLILQNPNLQKDEQLIEKEMWEKNETRKLLKDIEKHGGLITPVLVHNKYVLEGNTRLCCYRYLLNKTKDRKWSNIPCQVLDIKELPKEKVDALLGNEHIIGKQEWDTFEKGCWMNKMLKEDNYTYDKIKGIVGHSTNWIRNHIKAYDTMMNEKITDKNKFSHFVQLYSNGEISKINNQIDDTIINKTTKLIKNGQVPTAQHVRKIPCIWNDKKAKKQLLEGEDVETVFYKLKNRDITVDNNLLTMAKELTEKLDKITRDERNKISKSKRGKYIIKKLIAASKAFYKDL